MSTWRSLGSVKPEELTEGRLQLHYAIQFLAATGDALAQPLPDFSHTSLEWHAASSLFVGSKIRATTPFYVALDPVKLTLILLDDQSTPMTSLPLHQQTMAEGLDWLKQEIAKLGADAGKVVFLTYPPDDFPDHALARGATFDANQDAALSELANYYANTQELLQKIVATSADATTIRIWPHHFDMATLITLAGTRDGNPLTVGVGLSPGDTNYPEPYWYVSPYPYPAIEELPALDGSGFWHTQHWVGAVLPASHLEPTTTPGAQPQQVQTFLDTALKAGITLLSS